MFRHYSHFLISNASIFQKYMIEKNEILTDMLQGLVSQHNILLQFPLFALASVFQSFGGFSKAFSSMRLCRIMSSAIFIDGYENTNHLSVNKILLVVGQDPEAV